MKFCPECGSQLPIGTAKFCPNCGNNLWVATSSSEIGITVESKKEEKDNISHRNSFEKFSGKEQQEEGQQQQIKGEFQNQTTHSLGIKLEDTVVQILENRGYSTEMRRKLVGSSGAIHEIDVLARRQQQQNKVLAVECKNYSEARVVGIKEVRDFQSKIQDLPQITDAMFVTNTKFSSDAYTYANHNHITLYDGDKLKNDFYLMSIGRLESIPDIVLDSILPLAMSYNEATRLDLVNPNAARIARATLVFRPFYVFDYIIEETKKGFLRGSRPREEGIPIIDCLNGEILYKSHNVQSNSQSSYSLLSKSRIHHKDSEEVLSNIEKNQIIKDLQTIKPQCKYKIHPTGEYAIIILESKVPIDAARRMIKEIVEEKKIANYDNVRIIDRASSCIYVPKWIINIESHNNTYTREILGASNTILIDEMAYCPHEFFARFRASKKQTYAVCERCGGAYCSRHIERVNDSYFCREHR